MNMPSDHGTCEYVCFKRTIINLLTKIILLAMTNYIYLESSFQGGHSGAILFSCVPLVHLIVFSILFKKFRESRPSFLNSDDNYASIKKKFVKMRPQEAEIAFGTQSERS